MPNQAELFATAQAQQAKQNPFGFLNKPTNVSMAGLSQAQQQQLTNPLGFMSGARPQPQVQQPQFTMPVSPPPAQPQVQQPQAAQPQVQQPIPQVQQPLTPTQIAGQAGDMQPPVDQVPGQTTQDLLGQFQTQADEARAMNEQRYAELMDIANQRIGMYQPEGGFGAGLMEQYGRTKERALAQQQQDLISRGLFGTTTATGLGRSYEEQVGTPFRLQLADLQTQRLSEAMGQKAGAIERREDVPPSPELMAGLATAAEAGPTGEAGAGVTGGAGVGAGVGGGLWASGQMGPISSQQYTSELRRQDKYTTAQARIPALEDRVAKLQTRKAELEDKDKPTDAIDRQIAKQQANLDRFTKDVERYSPEQAGVSSVQFAQEQSRRREATAATEAAKPVAAMGGLTGALRGLNPLVRKQWERTWGTAQ